MRKIIAIIVFWMCALHAEKPYSELSITEADRKIIHSIIDSVGSLSYWSLWKKEDQLTSWGDQVQLVHPFRFLETIFTNPDLKKRMAVIEDDYFLMKGFMKGKGKTPGFAQKMERESKNNNLLPYVEGFCKAIRADPAKVSALIEKKEWRQLIEYLVVN